MAKLDYYAEVRILGTPATIASGIAGSIGVVGGFSSDPEGDSYAVLVNDETYMISESDLVPTGRVFSREDLYDGTSLKVPAERYADDEPVSPDE